ncbi:MAG TPA: hypothetical protein PKO15_08685 [Fibrobacteria bacterium]|nr:hypothetical protein [Fibrobacteria bacterium]
MSIQILKGETVVTSRFSIDTAPSVSGRSWDLSGLRLHARSGTEFGSYTMAIQVWDLRQSRILHTVPFQVEPRPDGDGPVIHFLSPTPNGVIEPKDSVIRLRMVWTDSSGIDSVTVEDRRAQISGDSCWLDVPTPLKSANFGFVVAAWDKQGNRSYSFLQVRRREVRDTLDFKLLSPSAQTGNNLDVDSAFLRVEYFARSPFGIADTGVRINRQLARRGSPPNDTDHWYLDVPVPASGEVVTIPVMVVDKQGGRTSHFLEVTRAKDVQGPTIRKITPLQDTSVDFDSPLVEIRVEVLDPSGIDSVRIQGRQPEMLAPGRYFSLVPVAADTTTAIHIRAWDRRGNLSDSVVKVIRLPSGKVLELIQPARRAGNVVPEDVVSFDAIWQLPKESNGYKVWSASQDDTSSLGAGKFRIRARNLVAGATRAVVICLKDTVKQMIAYDTVWVTREKAISAPKPRFLGGMDTLETGVLGTSDSLVNVRWALDSKCDSCQFEIDGSVAVVSKDTVGARISLKLGTSSHSMVMTWNQRTVLSRVNFEIRRFMAPTIKLASPASGLVRSEAQTAELVFKVEGATRAWVDGVEQTLRGDGTYRVTVAKPVGSSRRVVVAAADSGRGRDSVSYEIRWVVPVDFHVDPLSSSSIQWDAVKFTLGSAIPGVAFSWEADRGRKGTAKSGDVVSLLASGKLRVCASLAGSLDSCDSSAAFTVKHTNQPPSYTRASPLVDLISILEDAPRGELYLAQDLRKGGEWDSSQTLRFEVRSPRPGLYAKAPGIDLLTGILNFVPAADSFGFDTLSIRLCDDGGTENGGKDCSDPIKIKVEIKPVNDPPVGVDWSVVVPISDSSAKFLMDPIAAGPGEPSVPGMAFRVVSRSKNLGFAQPSVLRTGGKDEVKFVPGTQVGVERFQVEATDVVNPSVQGTAQSDTFDLSIKVVNSWSVNGADLSLAVAFGRTWIAEALRDSAESDSAGVAGTSRRCPEGWTLPDSLDAQRMNAASATELKAIGLADGDQFWTLSGTVPRLARLALDGGKMRISFPAAAKEIGKLRCVYRKGS